MSLQAMPARPRQCALLLRALSAAMVWLALFLSWLFFPIGIVLAQPTQTLVISARSCLDGDADNPFDCGSPIRDVTFTVGPDRLELVTDENGVASTDVASLTPDVLLVHPNAGSFASVAMACVAGGEHLEVQIADVDTAISSFLVDAPADIDIDCAMSFDGPVVSLPDTGTGSAVRSARFSHLYLLVVLLAFAAVLSREAWRTTQRPN